jgi:hypothetical protein
MKQFQNHDVDDRENQQVPKFCPHQALKMDPNLVSKYEYLNIWKDLK